MEEVRLRNERGEVEIVRVTSRGERGPLGGPGRVGDTGPPGAQGVPGELLRSEYGFATRAELFDFLDPDEGKIGEVFDDPAGDVVDGNGLYRRGPTDSPPWIWVAPNTRADQATIGLPHPDWAVGISDLVGVDYDGELHGSSDYSEAIPQIRDPVTGLAAAAGDLHLVFPDGSDRQVTNGQSHKATSAVWRGDAVRYVREQQQTEAPFITRAHERLILRMQSAINQLGGFTRLTQYLSNGQSGPEARSARPLCIGHDQPVAAGRALMFRNGPRIHGFNGPSLRAVHADWSILASTIDYEERISRYDGETHFWQFFQKLIADNYVRPREAVLGITVAIGASSIDELTLDTDPDDDSLRYGAWTNQQRAMFAGRALAEQLGLEYGIGYLSWWQGGKNRPDDEAEYRADLEEMVARFQGDALKIGGVTFEGPFVSMVQVAPHSIGVPNSEVGDAIWHYCQDNPTIAYCPGPIYLYPAANQGAEDGGDPEDIDSHKSALGHALLGAYDAIYRRESETTARLPLHLASWTRTGASVVLTFHNPIPGSPLVIDTSWVTDPVTQDPTKPYGLKFRQTGGDQAIQIVAASVAVDLVDFDTKINLTLSANPDTAGGTGRRIEVANSFLTGATFGGPNDGPRCCIRNTSTESVTIDDGDGEVEYTLHDYPIQATVAGP